jgi:multidrug resistance efflux pump
MSFNQHTPNKSSLRYQIKIFKRILIVIFVLGVSMLSVMIFGTMEDQVKGVGTVAGIREYSLKSLVSAKTIKIFHHEGEFVKRGETLLKFDDRNQKDNITVIKNEIKELEHQIHAKQKELELLKKDPLPAYYRHTKLQLDEAKEKLLRTEKEFQVYDQLYKQKVVTRREHLRVEMDYLSSRMAVQRLEKDWHKLEDGMAKIILSQAEEQLKLLTQKLHSKQDELKMAERRLEDYVMRAPDAGILTDIPPRAGGYYEKGETVVKFAANQNKKITGLIDEKQIYKVEPGQRVRIYAKQYNYLDYGYFEGRVAAVYQLPVEINKVNYYPVKIVLVGERFPLRFGSSCEITIITGRERIIFALMGIKSQGYINRRVRDIDKFQQSRLEPKGDLK